MLQLLKAQKLLAEHKERAQRFMLEKFTGRYVGKPSPRWNSMPEVWVLSRHNWNIQKLPVRVLKGKRGEEKFLPFSNPFHQVEVGEFVVIFGLLYIVDGIEWHWFYLIMCVSVFCEKRKLWFKHWYSPGACQCHLACTVCNELSYIKASKLVWGKKTRRWWRKTYFGGLSNV